MLTNSVIHRFMFILMYFVFMLTGELRAQKNDISNYRLNDSTKYREILTSIKKIEKSNPDSAILILNLLINNMIDHNDPLYVDAILSKGTIYHHAGNTDSSIYYLSIAAKLSAEKKYRFKEIQAINLIGLSHKKRGNYSECIKLLNLSIEKSKTYGLKEREATAYNNLGLTYRELGMFDKSIRYLSEAYRINMEIADSLSIMIVMNNLGLVNKDLKKYDEALKYYDQTLALAERRNDNVHKSMSYLNMGVIYYEQKDYNKALEYYYRSLNIKKVIGDKYKIAVNLSDIGNLYNEIGEYEKAIYYYKQAHSYFDQKGSFKEKVESNNALATAFINQFQFMDAEIYLKESQRLLNEKPSENYILYSETYKLLSEFYEKKKEYKKSLEFHILFSLYLDSIKTQELNEKIAEEKVKFDYQRQEEQIKTLIAQKELDKLKIIEQNQRLKLNNYVNTIIVLLIILSIILMIVFYRQSRKNKRINKLLQNNRKIILEKNYEITQQNEEIKAQTDQLFEINKELSQFMSAVDETDNAVVILDKEGYFLWANKGFDRLYDTDFKDFKNTYPHILNAARKSSNWPQIEKVITRCINEKTSGNYEFTTNNRSGENIWIHTGIRAVLDDFGEIQNFIVIDTDISENVKTARMIEIQNYELQKQKEELDSALRYAQSIQSAMLPSRSQLREFNDVFLIFMPKDIVSGDFYKFYTSETSPYLYYAVIDCTGHGVPGAFMSLIGEGLLTRSVNEKGLVQPSEILEEMNRSVFNTLKQNISGNRDGMDITLCRIEKDDKLIKEVVVSSARHAFYYYNLKKNKLHKIKGDVKSIGGKYYEDVKFTDKYLKIRKGDMLYLLSDGFIDQDSPEGKKIGSNTFFQLLEQIAILPVKKQKKKLIEFFNHHKKENHQRDDITILGIKIGK